MVSFSSSGSSEVAVAESNQHRICLVSAETGERLQNALAFQGLPAHLTLTLGLHTLGNWLVGAAGSPPGQEAADLDNLVLGSATTSGSDTLQVVVALENLVVEGVCMLAS